MDFFTILLIILFLAAIVDLIVGVSNDAVNFLNSAIGSKVAPLRTILIIASIGIVVGSTFSSGMMEIARNGLFNPSFFNFEHVMYLFLAVMLTDIILLDFFNNLGLPTSTTVSLVFELLGAAFCIGVLHSFSQGLTWNTLSVDDFINFSSAVTIVTGIFLSIFLAFFFGSIIQRISRLVFSFKIKKTLKKFGAVFCGLSITTIVYFLLIKGAKGSALITDVQIKWIMDHTLLIVLICLVFFSVLIQLIMWYTSINPLRIVVLLGTFALAMAFAGNDLVNFIGVAMGGLVAFQAWATAGVPADQFQMSALASKIATPTWILVVAGLIMVITLWTNAKSRKVTETEISLGRQDEGDERFRPNMLSRLMVGTALFFGRIIDLLVPLTWTKKLEERFEKDTEPLPVADQPSFDLVRASVNLLVSSVLIAYGTSQKLPLSTTFVTFMVAMGTSFADQAWGRESAVYRVAGVMNVIAGWLVTAIIAFSFSALVAFILFKAEMIGVVILTVIGATLLIRSHVLFAKKEKLESAANLVFSGTPKSVKEAIDESKTTTVKNLKLLIKVYGTSIDALAKEKKADVEKSMKKIRELREQNEKIQHKIIKYVRKMPKHSIKASRLYILMFDYMQDLYQSILLITESCTEHLNNYHSIPSKVYLTKLKEIEKGLDHYHNQVCDSIATGNFKDHKEMMALHSKWSLIINEAVNKQIEGLQAGSIGNRIGLLQMRLLLETKDMFDTIRNMYELYADYYREGN